MAGSNHFWKAMQFGRNLKLCVLFIFPSRADPCKEGDWRALSLSHTHTNYTHKDTIMAAFSDTCDSKVSRTSRLRGMYMKSKSNVCGSPQEQSDCSTVLEKSQEFFQICDTEDKGFVTRRDMQVRLQHAQEKMCCILNNCISNSKYRILYATMQYLIGIV